jgi:hypothetical protein
MVRLSAGPALWAVMCSGCDVGVLSASAVSPESDGAQVSGTYTAMAQETGTAVASRRPFRPTATAGFLANANRLRSRRVTATAAWFAPMMTLMAC